MIKLTKYERRAQNMAKIGSLKCVIQSFSLYTKNKIFISRFFASCRTYMQYIYAFSYSIFLISINSFYTKKNMIFISRFFASCRKDTLQYAFSYSIFIISITYHIPTYTKKSLYISVHSIHSEMKTFIQRCQKNGNKST